MGKRVAVEEWAGAGLAGRQFAAVGASLVRNPADGRAPLEELMLPLGPVRLYLSTGQRIALRPRVDLHNLFWTTYGLVDPALRLDPGATLSAGAPVFRAADRGLVWKQTGTRARGLALGGAIFLDGTPEAGGPGMDHVFAHERVHVLQTDQVFHTLFAPLESWLLGSLPEGQRLTRIVDLNLVLPALGYFLLAGGDYGAELPWEMEAYFLVPYRWSDGH